MLKRSLRLKSSSLFARALRHRQFYVDRFFAVYILKHPEKDLKEKELEKELKEEDFKGKGLKEPTLPQFGLIISKKTEKQAVKRNRAKRQFREALRTEIIPKYAPQLKPFRAVVIIIRPQALKASFPQLVETLGRCFASSQMFF